MTDREDVHAVIQRYARGIDRRDWDLVTSCFSPSATVEGTRFSGPIGPYLEQLRTGVEAFGATMHFMGNQLADIDGDTATTETYAVAYHFADPDGREEALVVGVRYHDRLVRTGDRWVIEHRRAVGDWQREGVAARAAQLERLLAYEEIRQLAHRYALAVDSRDLDSLVALFVDDVQVGRDRRGRDALRAFFDASLRDIGVSILNVGNHVIDLVDADHARGVVYCRGEIEDAGRFIVQAIVYTDTYERRAGRWLFVRRRHELFYGAEQSRAPLDLPPANWPEHQTGRGTLPEGWPTWRTFWAAGSEPRG